MLRVDRQVTVRCGDRVLDLSSPVVMGIINVTPDSFYPASRVGDSVGQAIDLAAQMISEGAQILDVGGMSSRPGAEEIPEEVEIERVIPVIRAIHHQFPNVMVSVDTYRSGVADAGIKEGVVMINDISGGLLDPEILPLVARHQLPYVLMHMRGTPKDMQLHTDYEDIITELLKYFIARVSVARQAGIRDVILDPGFGFSKTLAQNYQVIHKLGMLRILSCPILIGVSRKSTLSKTILRPIEESLEATTALHMAALLNGANILRVHDVRPAMDAIAVFEQLQRAENP